MRNVSNPTKIKSDKIKTKEKYENSKCPKEKNYYKKNIVNCVWIRK